METDTKKALSIKPIIMPIFEIEDRSNKNFSIYPRNRFVIPLNVRLLSFLLIVNQEIQHISSSFQIVDEDGKNSNIPVCYQFGKKKHK